MAVYEELAALFRYPEEDYATCVAQCARTLRDFDPEAADLIARFGEHIGGLSRDELQELFTQTFDLNPLCALELGWHLFGENYDRGIFLVKMRQELRRAGLPESDELPDHLTHVLEVIGRMEKEHAEDFVAACVLPALDKMLPAFGGKENPWEGAMQAVMRVLRTVYPEVPVTAPEPQCVLPVLS